MTRKRDALLTIAGIIVLFGLAFFVQEEMDSYHNCPFRACVFRTGGNGLLYPQNS